MASLALLREIPRVGCSIEQRRYVLPSRPFAACAADFCGSGDRLVRRCPKSKNHVTFHGWLRLYARVFLSSLLSYGL
jgi:hypothetical protein